MSAGGALMDRLDRWADTSRLNLCRMLVMPRARLSEPDKRAFDALLAATPVGGIVPYELPQPKWWFLQHLTFSGFVLHGSNEAAIDVFRTRQTFDAYGKPIDAVFATDDAIWPIYFAVVNRAVAQSYINWCVHVRSESRYLFSIGSDPRRPESWTTGTVYALPRTTFRPTPGSRELVSGAPVTPRARVVVHPDDFPLRSLTLRHHPGDTPRRVAVRNALRLPEEGLAKQWLCRRNALPARWRRPQSRQ